MTKFIVVAGGVISGVGKGVTTASLGKILKEHGYTTTLIKIDPYLNFDAGTLRPTEHGEVWVTDDGGEIDQDLGTYERFMDADIPKRNNMTTGQIYKAVIDKERQGDYLGQTVQIIPHIPEEINRRIQQAAEGFDIAIIEVGGTVGDYENIPFLFALKSLERERGPANVIYVLVTYLPVPSHAPEMKTKPTQQAIKLLREEGIFPDFIVCRSGEGIDAVRKAKIEAYAHVAADNIISAPDVKTIYQIPLDLVREQFDKKILAALGLPFKAELLLKDWSALVSKIIKPSKRISVAIVGKYVESGDYSIADSYLSINEALIHAGAAHDVGVDIAWLDAKQFEKTPEALHQLDHFSGVIVPGGFGAMGVEGKIRVIEYVRKHNIPYLGICYGMQLACVEFARNICGLAQAHTTEVVPDTVQPIVDILPLQKELLEKKSYGGTMRLGVYPALMHEGIVLDLYKKSGRLAQDLNKIQQSDLVESRLKMAGMPIVLERHRHRYEVNPRFVSELTQKGLVFSGFYEREDGARLMEFIELPGHSFFVATQAHPEFKSRLGNPSPLFFGFVEAAMKRNL